MLRSCAVCGGIHQEDQMCKRKYKKENDVKSKAAEVQYIKSETDDRICPRCGKDLVLRTARKGKNAGQQFYGCSGFPKCRYIRQL